MKTFYKVQLTICKTTKRFASSRLSQFYEDKSKAITKYKELSEYCLNYDDFCKGWKYLHVQFIERKFDD